LQLLESDGNFWKPVWKEIAAFGKKRKEMEIARPGIACRHGKGREPA
jgi:hypothetical protein